MENITNTPLSSTDETTYQQTFIDQLSTKERRAYEIAKSHLGMSFQLEKSVAYLKWKKQNSL
jgi:hypothetical protein